ncbi:hypothetical protein BGY98DRAFT_985590 [Russula aff. rugulosa BPL654]|nr:hypothetical protein BGY98DRAFT_985590 [Russula aff. rugulosa BPL654]
MRLYYVVSGIPLILSIIDLTVAAPVLIQEKPQARIDTRVGDWEEVWQFEVLDGGQPGTHFFAKPGPESSAARLSSFPQPPGPVDGQTNVKQSLPSTSKEPPSVMNEIPNLLMSKLAK